MNDSFENTIQYLYDLQFFGMKLGLDNTRGLLDYLGNPHHSFPTIHIAGTNGKGSTCSMIDSIFRAAGYKTGLYTSPHLFHFSERIRINGIAIPEEEIVRLTNKMRPRIDDLKCTFFEATTAMAFHYFMENAIDIGIIETGLGGRLDSTNVLDPLLSVITNIDLEHTEHLGKTIESIATEKAGIIKSGRPCLIGPVSKEAMNIFDAKAQTCSSALRYIDTVAAISHERLDIDGSCMDLKLKIGEKRWDLANLQVGLAGQHQLKNAALAVSSVVTQEQFEVSEAAIRKGLENVKWSGRLEVVHKEPTLITDAAHNPAGMSMLSEAIQEIYKPKFNRIFLIIGMLADKDYEEAVKIIAPHFTEIVTITPNSERALHGQKLAEAFIPYHNHVTVAESLEQAVLGVTSKMSSKDMLLVTGSHFVLSELKNIRQAF